MVGQTDESTFEKESGDFMPVVKPASRKDQHPSTSISGSKVSAKHLPTKNEFQTSTTWESPIKSKYALSITYLSLKYSNNPSTDPALHASSLLNMYGLEFP
eukprot:Ihof_evm4s311 gene=Ihof_evmTU4s311